MRSLLRSLVADTRGATAIEYGLLIGILCGLLIAAFYTTGSGLADKWTNLTEAVKTP